MFLFIFLSKTVPKNGPLFFINTDPYFWPLNQNGMFLEARTSREQTDPKNRPKTDPH